MERIDRKRRGTKLCLLFVIFVTQSLILHVSAVEDNQIFLAEFDRQSRLTSYGEGSKEPIRIEYNEQDCIKKISSASEHIEIEYNDRSYPVRAVGDKGSIDFKYDPFGCPERITYDLGSIKYADYQFDPWGNTSSLTLLDDRGEVEYSVKFDYDVLGRLRVVDDGYSHVTFDYLPSKNKIIRTISSGVTTEFIYNPSGLVRSTTHYDSSRREKSLASYDFQYDFASNHFNVTEVVGTEKSTRSYNLNCVHGLPLLARYMEPQNAVTSDISVNSDAGEYTINPSAGSSRYFCAPISTGADIIAEVDRNGRISRAFVTGQHLSMEFSPGEGTVCYLERAASPSCVPVSHRILTGRSASDSADAVSPEMRRADIKNVAMAPEYDWGHAIDITDSAVSFGKTVTDVAMFKADQYLSMPGLAKNEALYEMIGENYVKVDAMYTKIEKYVDGAGVVFAFGRDLYDIQKSNKSWQQKLVDHVVLGNTSELAAGHYASKLAEHVAGRQNIPFVGEGVGLAYDISRGKGWSSPDVWEHYCDIGYGALVGGMVYWYTGGSIQVASKAAKWASSIPDLPRALSRPYFERAGTWLGTTGSKRAGDWLWQASMAARTGNIDGFYDNFQTNLNDTIRVAGAGTWDACNEFEDALRAGDKSKMADMLENNKNFRKWIKSSGGTDAGIGQLVSDLRSGREYDSITNMDLKSPDQIGGIRLDKAAEFTGDLGSITGAVWNPDTKRLVLVCSDDIQMPGVRPEYIAAAILCVYRPYPIDPGFSLDPLVETDPDGPWYKARYDLPDELVHTDLGRIMYEADLELKAYCFGVGFEPDQWFPLGTTEFSGVDGVEVWFSGKSRSFNIVKRKSKVEGFLSMMDMSLANKSEASQEPMRARMWITSEKMDLCRTDNAVSFKIAKMGVEAMRQEIGPDGRLTDVADNNPLAKAIAENIKLNFDELALECRPFAEVRELAKAIAIVKWLREMNVDVDLDWARQIVTEHVDVVQQMSRVTVTDQDVTRTRTGNEMHIVTHSVQLSGGVLLEVRPKWLADQHGNVTELEKNVNNALDIDESPAFNLMHEGQKVKGYVLPIIKNKPIPQVVQRKKEFVHKGIAYSTDSAGKIVSAADKFGNGVEYTYDSSGKVRSMDMRTAFGRRAYTEKTGSGTTMELHDQFGDCQTFDYDTNNVLRTVSVNGRPYAKMNYSSADKSVSVDYAGSNYHEKVVYDDQGRPVCYSRMASSSQAGDGDKALRFTWGEDGNLMGLTHGASDSAIFKYSDGRLVYIESQNGQWRQSFDKQGRWTALAGPDDTYLSVSYDGQKIGRVALSIGNQKAYIDYQGGRAQSSKGFDGKRNRYLYDFKGRLEKIINSDSETTYQYNPKYDVISQITTLGSRFVFDYYDEPRSGGQEPSLSKMRILRNDVESVPVILPSESTEFIHVPASSENIDAVDSSPVSASSGDSTSNTAAIEREKAIKEDNSNNSTEGATTSSQFPVLGRGVITFRSVGGDIQVDFGRGYITWNDFADKMNNVSILRGDEAIAEVSTFIRANYGRQFPSEVLLVHDPHLNRPIRAFRNILAEIYPETRFFTTSAPDRARRNIDSQGVLRGNTGGFVESWVVWESLERPMQKKTIIEGLRKKYQWLVVDTEDALPLKQRITSRTQVIIIIGDLNGTLIKQIKSAGTSGLLAGKAVILLACNLDFWMEESYDIVDKYKATMLWQGTKEIHAQTIPIIIDLIDEVIDVYPDIKSYELMDKVIEKGLENLKEDKKGLEIDLRSMQKYNLMSRVVPCMKWYRVNVSEVIQQCIC